LAQRTRQPSPESEISFDDIAYPASKDTIPIDKVVDIDWISHLGCSLYVHPSPPFRELRDNNSSGTLACRFALEFNMDVSARDVRYEKVERHMRLCIAAIVGLEKLRTIPASARSGSDPGFQGPNHFWLRPPINS